MIDPFLFSTDSPPLGWSDAESQKLIYGPKGALLAVVPRSWSPPFVLIPASFLQRPERDGKEFLTLSNELWSRIASLAADDRQLIVRSSILGESIWDRGTYKSVVIQSDALRASLPGAAAEILASAGSKRTALVIQRYVQPRARGEFGNLLRVSRTRDHWELSTEYTGEGTSRIRFNAQRDEAAPLNSPLLVRRGLPQERLFGSIAAWLNNELLRGQPQRINCEWITNNNCIFIVQIDEEDEDLYGVNPFQINVAPFLRSETPSGSLLLRADKAALRTWDKLKVLDELWEQDVEHKPVLFYIPLSNVPSSINLLQLQELEQEFRTHVGPDSIIVRTSGRADAEKSPNLPRTECLKPAQAVAWCVEQRDSFELQGVDLRGFAFVTHRFIASRASAWVRAAPRSPSVEIHGLWGLPDALQYCPYDIWEVHVPTEVATEYPEYKSNILIPRDDGGWEYVRIKNDLARFLSIGRREAIEIASRSIAIAERIGKPCHIMWFVGCIESDGTKFNMPWYWVEGYEAEKNLDRTNYKVVTISDPSSLEQYKKQTGSRLRQAIELRPTNLNLMRDTKFIDSVGAAAATLGVPVVLSGSTLAHAYYQLRRQGSTVVTRGEKEYSRVRRNLEFGKLVRDKIPERIAQRKETETTRVVPQSLSGNIKQDCKVFGA
jgi:hypothetical protein